MEGLAPYLQCQTKEQLKTRSYGTGGVYALISAKEAFICDTVVALNKMFLVETIALDDEPLATHNHFSKVRSTDFKSDAMACND